MWSWGVFMVAVVVVSRSVRLLVLLAVRLGLCARFADSWSA